MRTRFLAVAAALSALAACAQPQAEAPLETEEQKTIYALGLAASTSLKQFNLSEDEVRIFVAGLSDSLTNKPPKVELATYGPKLDELAQSRRTALAQGEKEAAVAFLDQAAAEPGAERTESGIIYHETQAGSGAQPTATDRVKVHYHGTLRDGTVFDSSVDRGSPATFPLNGVIPCWTEALQKMKVGSKVTITCPANLAYGDRGAGSAIHPGAALRFDIELIDIEKAPAAPQ
jgi:FKBP-type peptidyl-prolyl cis-trans isomerase